MNDEKSIMESLNHEIKSELDNLSDLEAGTEKHEKAVKAVKDLYEVRNEENKIGYDINLKAETHADEMAQKDEESKRDFKSKVIGFAIGGLTSLAGLIMYEVQNRRGYKFESEDTYGSTNFRENRNSASKFIK